MKKWDKNKVKLHNFIIFRWSKGKLGLQLRPRLQKAKGLSQKNVKSITFTFASQSGATYEIKFLLVYWDCWLTLAFQKESRFPENQTLRKSFFPLPTSNTCIMGLRSTFYRALGPVIT